MHEAAAPAKKSWKQRVADARQSAYQHFTNAFQWTRGAVLKYRYGLLVLLAGLLAIEAYRYFLVRGIFCELVGAVLVGLLVIRRTGLSEHQTQDQKPLEGRKLSWRAFGVATAVFLLFFPFFTLLHAIGLAPGILFILAFTYLCGAFTREHGLEALLGAVLLGMFVWIWGEAGRPGLVVMPVDLPAGRDDLEFTADGVANALETELENFGLKDSSSNFGQIEASKILAFDMHARLFPNDPWYIFPESPWYKGSDSRPASLAALYGSHVVIGTQVEGFPLSSVYHILRHLRGKPLLEAQILIGDDKSLTLALRRFNYPLNCMSETLSRDLLNLESAGSGVNHIWREVGKTNPPPRVPDTLGCPPNPLRWALDKLDIVGWPSGGEERVANVTVSNDLQGDAQLTAALQLAALQAMGRLSPERLALYYDNAGMFNSALGYFNKSLPDMLKEAVDSPPITEDPALQRLTNALIRIGDLQNEADCAPLAENQQPVTKYKNRSYDLASGVLPGDLSVQARIGYGLLLTAKQIQWSKQVKCLVNGQETEKQQLLKQAIDVLKEATTSNPDIAKRRYGFKRSKRTLLWAYANLAYAYSLSGDQNAAQNTLRAMDNDKALGKDNDNDLRAMIVKAYLDCGNLQPLRDFYRKLIHDPPEPYTLHNNILMEEQLSEMYLNCGSPEEATRHKILFKSLLALGLFQRSTASSTQGDFDERSPLPAEQAFADLEGAKPLQPDQGAAVSLRRAFLASIGQARKSTEICAIKNLTGVDKWRGDSLCARVTSLACKGAEGGANLKLAEAASKQMLSDPYVRANLGIARLKRREPEEQIGKGTEKAKGTTTEKEKALSDFRAAVSLNGRDPKLRYLLGYTLLALKYLDEGKREMRNGELLDPGGWPQIEKYFQRQENSLSTCPSQ